MMYPFVTSLALSFLILVGVALIVEGFDIHAKEQYLFCHGIFRPCGDAQYSHAQKTRGADQTVQPLCNEPRQRRIIRQRNY